MVDKKEIMALLKANFKTTGSITIDDKGLVSCTGMVNLKKKLKRLPVAFDKVGGDFFCHINQLTTLEGAPTSVGGNFFCYNNQLTTLEGAPTSVGGDFFCHINQQLTTLEGLPTIPGILHLSYSSTLPLLRCLLAKKVQFYPYREDKTIETILNLYAGQGKRAMFDCQKELEDAGFEGNARW
jgi:hypothetical protein